MLPCRLLVLLVLLNGGLAPLTAGARMSSCWRPAQCWWHSCEQQWQLSWGSAALLVLRTPRSLQSWAQASGVVASFMYQLSSVFHAACVVGGGGVLCANCDGRLSRIVGKVWVGYGFEA